ncbi:MAG: helix-turn-helix domain-containing protein [Cyanobacteria bacterium P01_F01_bin.42]
MTSQNTVHSSSFAESLQDIGERLRIIRLQQDLSLEAISRRTRVAVKHLNAIESGDEDALPEPVFIRGFIRRYAEALNQEFSAFDIGTASSALVVKEPSRRALDFGVLVRRLQYPLYGLMIVAVSSVMVYVNNRDLSPAPAQSSVETPVVSRNDSEL